MLQLFREAGRVNSNNTTYQFWRLDNKPIELFSHAMFDRYLNYLHLNPVKAGYVENADEYVYSSAPALAGKPGLLKLDRE